MKVKRHTLSSTTLPGLIRSIVLMHKCALLHDHLTGAESALAMKLNQHAIVASVLHHHDHHCYNYPLTFLPSHSVCPLTMQALTCWLQRSPALLPGQCSGWQPPALAHTVSFTCNCRTVVTCDDTAVTLHCSLLHGF